MHIFERVSGLTFTGIGVAAIFFPFDISPFLRLSFSSDVAIAVFAITGIIRMMISVLRQDFVRVRIILATASCALWGQWVFVLINAAVVQGAIRPGIFHVSAMVYGEIALIYWLVVNERRAAGSYAAAAGLRPIPDHSRDHPGRGGREA